MLLDLTCPECGTGFQRPKSVAKRVKGASCCSVTCSAIYKNRQRKNGKVVCCENCKKKVYRSEKQLQRSELFYCSKSCSLVGLNSGKPKKRYKPKKEAVIEKLNDKYWRRRALGRAYEFLSIEREWDGWIGSHAINELRLDRGVTKLSTSGILARVERGDDLFEENRNHRKLLLIQSYPPTTKLFAKLLRFPAPNYRPKPTFGYATT